MVLLFLTNAKSFVPGVTKTAKEFIPSNCFDVTPKDCINKIKYNHPNNIVLGHLNINSIRNNFSCLKHIIGKNVDILLISESKLNESFPESQFIIDGFQLPFRENRNERGDVIYLAGEFMSNLCLKLRPLF